MPALPTMMLWTYRLCQSLLAVSLWRPTFWHVYRIRALSRAMKLPLTIFFAVVVMVPLCSPRQAMTGAPTDELRARIERIQKIAAAVDARPEDRQVAVAVMDEIFDWPAIARDVLRAQWELRTPEEREEFTTLFAYVEDPIQTGRTVRLPRRDH